MSVNDNINKNLDNLFKNHDFLPQKLFIEDLDGGTVRFIKSLNLTIPDENDNAIPVPLIFLNQERWAEFRNNWKNLRDEGGNEITMPFMTIRRTSFKQQQTPLKRATIPQRMQFKVLDFEVIDGNQKAVHRYKIPQPTKIDINYELRFFSHYMQDANKSYELIVAKTFSDYQRYFQINGHDVFMELTDNSEDNTEDDISADRRFQIIYNLVLHGKIVDPSEFVKVPTITKIQVNFKEIPR